MVVSNIFGFDSNMAVYWIFEIFAFGLFMACTMAFLRWLIFTWIEKWSIK
jgi:hypothetical protein